MVDHKIDGVGCKRSDEWGQLALQGPRGDSR